MTWRDVINGDARWTLIHGNCLQVLPELPDRSVGHVITDPPYLLDFSKCITRGRRDPTSRKRDMGYAPFTAEGLGAVAPHLARLADRWCLVFSDVESIHLWRASLVDGGQRYIRTGAWARSNPCPQFSGDRPGVGFEAATICHAKERRVHWNGGGLAAIWAHPQLHGTTADDGNAHPTPKPISLMLELVELFTDPGDIVLDPFAGSGTTGVACLRLGRRFIGIEKDAKFAAVARERLEAESKGLTLRDARAGQLPLLGGI
jgi:DNA modification methylase